MSREPPPVSIPGNRLSPIARKVARSAKWIAAPILLLGILMFAGGVAVLIDDWHEPDKVSNVIGVMWLPTILGSIFATYVRKAMRASKVAELASAENGYAFTLVGTRIDVRDHLNAARPELRFAISRKQRAALLAIPQAVAVRTE